jgi:hypothetical protein
LPSVTEPGGWETARSRESFGEFAKAIGRLLHVERSDLLKDGSLEGLKSNRTSMVILEDVVLRGAPSSRVEVVRLPVRLGARKLPAVSMLNPELPESCDFSISPS